MMKKASSEELRVRLCVFTSSVSEKTVMYIYMYYT